MVRFLRDRLGRVTFKHGLFTGALASTIVGLVGASAAVAAPIDIDLINNMTVVNGDGQGSIFTQTDQQPTGTGVIKPFLTIQRKGREQGYNSDVKPLELDAKRAGDNGNNGWTRSLRISDLAEVKVNGQAGSFLKFLLDVNEDNSDGHLLSLNKLQLFVTNDANLSGYTPTTTADPSFTVGTATDGFYDQLGHEKAHKVYDLDQNGDRTVQLDYSFNHGSGSGDMYVYIPTSVLAGRSETYLTMYSSFGSPYASSAGFEEWSTLTGSKQLVSAVPLPSVAVAGLALIGGLGLKRRRASAN